LNGHVIFKFVDHMQHDMTVDSIIRNSLTVGLARYRSVVNIENNPLVVSSVLPTVDDSLRNLTSKGFSPP
jgi:hypothetical protein